MRQHLSSFPVASLLLLAALALAAAPAARAADAPLAWDFARDTGKAWSTATTLPVGAVTVLGPFNKRSDKAPDGATLRLTGLAPAPRLLSFDLYLIGSWDSAGSDKADTFEVSDGAGNVLLRMTEFPCRIEGTDEGKPIGHAGLVKTQLSERELGYWVVPVRIELGPESVQQGALTLNFKGAPTARRVESWGLANVRLDPR